MSISQLFPEEGPTLNLNFAGSKTLDPRITFSRTSTGTYMDDSGLIKVAPADAPRFDHLYVNGEIESLGLLVEESRTNIVRRSQDFTIASGYWSEVGDGVTVTTDQAIAPDGTQTADKVSIKTTDLGGKGIQSSILNPSVASQTYTVSIFLKEVEHSFVRVQFEGGGNTNGVNVNLSNGTLISLVGTPDDYKIIPYPNNWYRIVVTNTAANTNASALRWFLVDSNGNANFSGTVGNGVYAWGGQFETGSFVTSYIPTTNSTATRNPDNVSIIGDNFSDWYNQSEGSVRILAKTNRIYSGSNQFPYSMQIDDGTGSNRIAVDNGVLSSTIRQLLSVWENGSAVGDNLGNLQNVNGLPCAFAYKTNDIAFVNGAGTLFTDDNAPIATTMNRLQIGSGSGGILTGHISQLTYYPRRLSNENLQNLTK